MEPSPRGRSIVPTLALEGVATAIDQKRIAGSGLDSLRLGNGLELPPVNRFLESDPRLLAVARDVKKNAACEDALAPIRHVADMRSIRLDLLLGVPAIPEPVRVPYVAERIDVGDLITMVDETVIVEDTVS